MKMIVTGPNGSVKFNGSTPRVLAIMHAIRKAGRPLRVKDILEKTHEVGVLMKGNNEKNEASNILQKLMSTGYVYHPDVTAGKVKYALRDEICATVEV